MLTLGLFNFTQQDNAFAKTNYKQPEEWVRETLAHKSRIIQYANKLYPHLTELHDHWDYFIKYLELHDAPKVMSLDEILTTTPEYNHSEPISVRMAIFYGQDIKDMTPDQKENFIKTRDDLNHIERVLKEEFKQTLPSGTPDFSEIELVLDFIDTTIFRLEELNINPKEAHLYLAVDRFAQRNMLKAAKKASSVIDILQDYLLNLLEWKKRTTITIFSLLTLKKEPVDFRTLNLCNLILTY